MVDAFRHSVTFRKANIFKYFFLHRYKKILPFFYCSQLKEKRFMIYYAKLPFRSSSGSSQISRLEENIYQCLINIKGDKRKMQKWHC